ncbi:hypothetical protein [Polyangium jinanense]|uniref:Uncharacterized protein n=1 Tax=Polyangium jinanense TaxID=2829994 RepID=A0A9X3X7B3_9BACT|nr:hypothetical protein [Polyangium jinanense]MDC3985007.1 hypothetical protein [Polyangium jinanense]
MSPPRTSMLPALFMLAASCAPTARPKPTASSMPPEDTPNVTRAKTPEGPEARWVRTGRTTRVILPLPEGTLVLMGGRRALVRADGSILDEKVLTPEPLDDMLAVPTPRGLRLVGYNSQALYRFDDPLGEPRVLVEAFLVGAANTISKVGAGPGFVAVWDSDGGGAPALLLDVETGATRTLAGWPDVPPTEILFRSMDEGAVVFESIGLALTRDGGKTFQVPDADKPEERVYDFGLGRRRDRIEAVRGDFRAPIDFANNRVGAFARRFVGMAQTNPTLAWIEATETDPIELAIRDGSPDPRGGVFIAVNRMAARVDPRTGAALEVAWNPLNLQMDTLHDPHWHDIMACRAAHLPDRGLVFCPMDSDRVETAAFSVKGPLTLRRVEMPKLSQTYVHEVVQRPRGALVFFGHCAPPRAKDASAEAEEERVVLCASGAGGDVEPVRPAPDLYDQSSGGLEGVGALDDGTIVHLKGITGNHVDPQGESGVPIPETRFELFSRSIKPELLPPITFDEGARGPTKVLGSIEQDESGALHAMVSLNDEIVHVRQPLSGPATVTPLSAHHAQFRRGRGVILGDDLLLSPDAGASWFNAGPLPKDPVHKDATLGALPSESGIAMLRWLRVGWGPAAPYPSAPPPPVGPPLAILPKPSEMEPTVRTLSCARRGRIGAAPPLWDARARQAMYDAASGAVSTVDHRLIEEVVVAQSAEVVAGRLEAFASSDGETAERWTLQAIDPHETTGKVDTWTVPAPPDVPLLPDLDGVVRRGNRTLFVVFHHEGGRLVYDLVLATPGKPPRTTRLRKHPDGSFLTATLGPNDDDPVVGNIGQYLFAWMADGSLRNVAPLHGPRNVAEAGILGSKDLPVLLNGYGWAAVQTLPLGAGANATSPLPLHGWTLHRPPMRGGFWAMPTCRPGASGMLFRLREQNERILLEVDGVKSTDPSIHALYYEIRVDKGSACIESVDVSLGEEELPDRPHPFGFVTAHFPKKTAHAMEWGDGGSFVRMACTLH